MHREGRAQRSCRRRCGAACRRRVVDTVAVGVGVLDPLRDVDAGCSWRRATACRRPDGWRLNSDRTRTLQPPTVVARDVAAEVEPPASCGESLDTKKYWNHRAASTIGGPPRVSRSSKPSNWSVSPPLSNAPEVQELHVTLVHSRLVEEQAVGRSSPFAADVFAPMRRNIFPGSGCSSVEAAVDLVAVRRGRGRSRGRRRGSRGRNDRSAWRSSSASGRQLKFVTPPTLGAASRPATGARVTAQWPFQFTRLRSQRRL